MQCSVEEIEAKRRQALEKLKKKNLTNFTNDPNPKKLKTNNFHADISLFNLANNIASTSTVNRFSSPHKNNVKTPHASPLRQLQSPNNFNSKPNDKSISSTSFYGASPSVTGTCALISEDRFIVELSGYNIQAIETFKTIPSKFYSPATKQWSFHINDYELLQKKCVDLQPDVALGKIPNYVLNCCKTSKSVNFEVDLSAIDQELLNALMPFQEQGVCFGIDKGGRCLIGDEMGLGKTFQALAIASYYKADWPVLIATTASMKNVWEETIHKYLPSISIMHTQYMVSGKDYVGDAKILIVSHDMMSRVLEKLYERKFGILIVDESHILKNFKAKCTKAATKLAKQAKRVILLSGTPALSRPSELYTQLSLIDESFFGTFFEYSKRYCDAKTTHFGWDASGKSNLQELEIILGKKFMIRRTKEEVLKSLPNKVQEVVTLDVNLSLFSKEDRECLNALANNYNKQKKGNEKHAAMLTFFAETAKIKIPSVCSYILQTLEENQKFIVFAHHQKMLNAIECVLTKKNKKFIRIDGNTSGHQRKYFVDKFQFDDNYVCALLSITAANAGITLTASKLVLFAELHWNPSILSQAESRAHRIGQLEKVTVKYLLGSGTADDYIWPLLQNKQKILQEAGLFKESFDNVTVTKQHLNNKQALADCLQSYATCANTLDISTYFISSEKDEKENKNTVEPENKELDFFNDDLDDVLSKVEVNL